MFWQDIVTEITLASGKKFEMIRPAKLLSGGCINQGYQLFGSNISYFIKLNRADLLSMFNSEAEALREIASTLTIRVPQPITTGITDNYSFLVLEWLEPDREIQGNWTKMGENLAHLHSISVGKNFGWQQDNNIGTTPQINHFSSCWADFFANGRIGYQLKVSRGIFGDKEIIVQSVKSALNDHQPSPSLVHGDLWSGNAYFSSDGEPTILDPAAYYGDREVDIAMTELFGGFPADFYQGYNRVAPLEHGYPQRRDIYNLYHVLNHFNLFGGNYQMQAQNMIQQLLRNT